MRRCECCSFRLIFVFIEDFLPSFGACSPDVSLQFVTWSSACEAVACLRVAHCLAGIPLPPFLASRSLTLVVLRLDSVPTCLLPAVAYFASCSPPPSNSSSPFFIFLMDFSNFFIVVPFFPGFSPIPFLIPSPPLPQSFPRFILS